MPKNLSEVTLPVIEIFASLQGEATHTGCVCTFIRLYGCNLRCAWCDTKYSYDSKETPTTMSIVQIMEKVRELGSEVVELTGGEPLIHGKNVRALIDELVAARYEVLLETNGSQSLEKISNGVHVIMDVKCPSSGNPTFLEANFGDLNYGDDVKFIIANRIDFDFACTVIRKFDLPGKSLNCIFSPAAPDMDPALLAKWVLEEWKGSNGKLTSSRIKMQLQLHKILWGNERGR